MKAKFNSTNVNFPIFDYLTHSYKKNHLTILFLCFTAYATAQNYMSTPYRIQEPSSSINIPLIKKALEKRQRDYDNSRKISCYDWMLFLMNNADSSDYISIKSSTMLSGVRYYFYKNTGYVIVYVKDNSYDFNDSDDNAYVYCNINELRWQTFVQFGTTNSWGESFHSYIENFKCDCK
ncbi:hypothetical protein [Flavobacterium sp. 140616W15]|uniref:hypothetical protein n=1 Tax=Flavobacterium sp. 140616W15 TaxID=2478552 RepID=UPI000F0C539F|nr:hypothetical protein [Flavobacterium sp. 140616W15]AYN05486.1 hypothetical protein EAG11_16010 [Flavobacterium sp. 140616W15]